MSVKRYVGYETIKPFRNNVNLSLPYSITVACAKTTNNVYKYAVWDKSDAIWTLNAEKDYATFIMDDNAFQFPRL